MTHIDLPIIIAVSSSSTPRYCLTIVSLTVSAENRLFLKATESAMCYVYTLKRAQLFGRKTLFTLYSLKGHRHSGESADIAFLNSITTPSLKYDGP